MSLSIYLTAIRPTCVFDANITHNLGAMAEAAGIYDIIWRPEEVGMGGIKIAAELIEPLRQGLKRLRDNPDMFKALNPANGWGDYDGLVRLVSEYLAACEEFPDATITANR